MRDKMVGAAGLILSGAAAYAYLTIAARSLGPAGFAAVGGLWAIVFLLTAAFAAPLEAATARAVAAARGRGQSPRHVITAAFAMAGVAGLVAVVVAIPLGPWIDRSFFLGQAGFALAAALAFGGLAIGAAAKGTSAGGGRLASWGAYLFLDGGTRLLLCLMAAIVAPRPEAFAVALAAGPWLALAGPAAAVRHMAAGTGRLIDRPILRALLRTTAPLVVAAAAASSLIYFGSVALPFLEPGSGARVGSMIAALSLARLPLFMLSPFIAVILPRIAFALERGASVQARSDAVLLVGGSTVAGLCIIGAAVFGDGAALSSIFGADFILTSTSIVATGIAAAGWLVATAATSVAIAGGSGRAVSLAWGSGLVVAVSVGFLGTGDPFARIDAAIVLGSITAAITASIAAVSVLRSRATSANLGLAA